jgi:hypothetical protein
MCFRLSETKLWKAWRGSVLPLVCLGLSFVALTVTLVTCYAIALGNGHLAMYGGSLPPISALGGNYPEQGLFIGGFFVSCLCSMVTVTFRSAQIDEAAPGHWANNLLFVLALFGLPWLIVMSSISMYNEQLGWLHLSAAGVALAMLSSYVFWTSVLSLYLMFRGKGPVVLDSRISRNVRLGLNLYSGILSLTAPILFAVWVSDVSVTPIEWTAVVLIYSSLLPYFVIFFHARRVPGGYEEIN